MEKWHFGINNDYLVQLVLDGKKTATTSIYDGEKSTIGKKSIITYENGQNACLIMTTNSIITEYKNITEDLALLEGEGNFNKWKEIHNNFFKSIDPNFNDNTIVEFEIFKVIKKY